MSQPAQGPCDLALIRSAGPALPCPRAMKPWVLACAILGSSMAFVDGTVVNVALPAIQRDLRATAFQAQWVVEAYALFLASLMLVGGALGDHFGRRRVFAIGVGLFTAASVACAASSTIWQLVFARAVQGVGAALLVPGSLALISANFDEKERGHAIGVWSGASSITAALGPVLGGVLVDRYSWAWAFLINLPLGIAVLAIALLRVPESRGSFAHRPLDISGSVLATLSLGTLVYAFIEAPVQGWREPRVIAAILIAVIAGAAFVSVQARGAAPMLPLGLFRNRNFAGANLLTLLLYAALGGGLFFLPFTLIQVQRYSAAAAGAALLPFIVVMFALSGWAGRLVDRFGARAPLTWGPLVAALGFGGLAVPGLGGSYWTTYFPAVVVLGLGMALTVAPLTTTVMNSVGVELAGVASGVNNAVSRTAGLLAVAVFGIVLAWRFEPSLERALAAMNASPDLVDFVHAQMSRLAAIEPPSDADGATSQALRGAVRQAYLAGFRYVMLVSAALAVLSSLAAAVFIEPRKAADAHHAGAGGG